MKLLDKVASLLRYAAATLDGRRYVAVSLQPPLSYDTVTRRVAPPEYYVCHKDGDRYFYTKVTRPTPVEDMFFVPYTCQPKPRWPRQEDTPTPPSGDPNADLKSS